VILQSAERVAGRIAPAVQRPPRAGPPVEHAERIRIVSCINNMHVGGTELNALRTAESLDRARFDLTVACLRPGGPLAERYAAAGIRVVEFPLRNLYGAGALREGRRFARFLREHRTDVLHCHDYYANIFGSVWGRVARTPAIIASRRWWYSLPARKLRVANRVAYMLADRVLANSPSVGAAVQRDEGVGADRVVVVPNFADESAFQAPSPAARAELRLSLGVPGDAFAVGIISRLVPVKDHASLLEAVAQLAPRWPRLHLVIVGDGECRADLESRARALGIADRVRFAGMRANTPNLHHLFDLSVLCSLSEGFPNSIVEAMAAGRPVVATAVGGSVDAVDEGETGFLVPPAEPDHLAVAIEAMMANPALRAQMGAAGRRRADAEYRVERVMPVLEHLYETLAARAAEARR
jgi:glycosyltransferase involved in cell wall biosynthesis